VPPVSLCLTARAISIVSQYSRRKSARAAASARVSGTSAREILSLSLSLSLLLSLFWIRFDVDSPDDRQLRPVTFRYCPNDDAIGIV